MYCWAVCRKKKRRRQKRGRDKCFNPRKSPKERSCLDQRYSRDVNVNVAKGETRGGRNEANGSGKGNDTPYFLTQSGPKEKKKSVN